MSDPSDDGRGARHRTTAADERALVSCQPLSAVFEAVAREGRDTAELLVGIDVPRQRLLDRRARIHWDDFCTVIENAARPWSEAEMVRFGQSVVHSRAQRPFALIAKHLFSVADFYRAVCSPRTGYGSAMFPCMESKFVQLGEGRFETTLTLHDGFRHCPEFFEITRGNFAGIPEVLGSPAAQVHLEMLARGARFEIVAEDRSGLLARLRRRLGLPFRAKEMAAELQEAHASLRSRYDVLQDALRERERAEAALRESDARNRLLIEHVGDAFFVIAEDGRLLDVNGRACDSLGYSREELLERCLFDIDADWDERRFDAEVVRTPDGVTLAREGIQRRRDGSTFPVEVRGSWVSDGDGTRRFYCQTRDVSELRAAQAERDRHAAELRHTQKLEALGTLAGGIMHDFNNLLQAITGHTELALSAVEADCTARSSLGMILSACQRGEKITRQILTFSRETGQARRPTELGRIVREGIELLSATIPKSIEVRTKVAECRAWVMADEGQLQQVLMNLCTNAAHAMERGGVLSVTVDVVDATVRLTVRDTGCGIPADILDRVFDPFFTTKDVDNGTGLGLAVVHGIVQSHRGTIEIESRVGEGTTVTVDLPRHEEGAEPARDENRTTFTGAGRVLAVDDEPVLAELLQQTLLDLGFDVEVFVDSVEAQRRFHEDPHAFDFVITDQTMPKLTGLGLARAIRSVRSDIAIVLISGMGAPADESDVESAGIAEILPKPFTTKQLTEVLARHAPSVV